jgi:iron-sulfur cluster insertion protein
MSQNVTVTENAFKRVRFLAEKSGDANLRLRISVTGGGCSGFSYNYAMVEDYSDKDIVFSNDQNFVVIDKKSIKFLKDSQIDFVEELGSSYFSITNPNATVKCGCGNSFGI